MATMNPCEPVDLAFKMAEQAVSENLIKFRQRPSNGYWGKVKNAGMFPIHKGTSIKGRKLPRVGLQPVQFEGVVDTVCATNLCNDPPHTQIYSAGHEEFTYTLQRGEVITDWICLDALIFREMPEEQLMHFERALQQRTADVWDDKLRIEYINGCENKLMVLVDSQVIADGTCDCQPAQCTSDAIQQDAFRFVVRANNAQTGAAGQIDPRYLLVNIDPDDLGNIGMLTTDLLEEAAQMLEYEDENKPFIGEGLDLYDVVLPHNNIARDLFKQEDEAMNNAMSYGGYEPAKLKRILNTTGVLRNQYSLRVDKFALRYFPDTAYNAGLSSYSSSDPTTWARLVRVFPYYPVANPNGGVKWLSDPNYVKAPFGIATIFSPEIIDYLGFPEASSIGSAQKEPGYKNYGGKAVWHNPPWPCNLDRNMGFWKVDFGLAVRPIKPEYGYAWLVRLNHKITVAGLCCDIPSTPCYEDPTPYCIGTTVSGESPGTNFGALRSVKFDGNF